MAAAPTDRQTVDIQDNQSQSGPDVNVLNSQQQEQEQEQDQQDNKQNDNNDGQGYSEEEIAAKKQKQAARAEAMTEPDPQRKLAIYRQSKFGGGLRARSRFDVTCMANRFPVAMVSYCRSACNVSYFPH